MSNENSEQDVFPHQIIPLEPALNRQIMKEFSGHRSGMVRVGSEGWMLPARYTSQAQGYYTMPLRPDDVFIATFPRSGTTWCQELVWLINNNFDYETARRVPLSVRVPFLEYSIIHHPKLHKDLKEMNDNRPEVNEILKFWLTPGYELASKMSSPRHFKTHLPFCLLPPSLTDCCKVIYIARNPLDVAVSFYHHNRHLAVHGYSGDFEKYWKYFKDSLVMFSPYWDHVKQGWARRKNPNVLFLYYEDLIMDLPKCLRTVSEFLGKDISNDQLEKLTKHLHIDNFRVNVPLQPNVQITGLRKEQEQGFIRKGKVKDNNNEFTKELQEDANKWVAEQLTLTDLRFPVI